MTNDHVIEGAQALQVKMKDGEGLRLMQMSVPISPGILMQVQRLQRDAQRK